MKKIFTAALLCFCVFSSAYADDSVMIEQVSPKAVKAEDAKSDKKSDLQTKKKLEEKDSGQDKKDVYLSVGDTARREAAVNQNGNSLSNDAAKKSSAENGNSSENNIKGENALLLKP